MKLMEEILSEKNLKMAIKKVKQSKGAPGVDKMTVQEVERWFEQYREELISKMMNKQYRPMPVKDIFQTEWEAKTFGNSDGSRPSHPAGRGKDNRITSNNKEISQSEDSSVV
ncbi:MAG: hypothetical protein ACLVJ6_07295 [Merdibacter sp.]